MGVLSSSMATVQTANSRKPEQSKYLPTKPDEISRQQLYKNPNKREHSHSAQSNGRLTATGGPKSLKYKAAHRKPSNSRK